MLPFIILTNLRLLIACNTFPSCTIRGESVEARKKKNKILCLLLLSIPADFLCAAVDYNPHKLYNLTNELKFLLNLFLLIKRYSSDFLQQTPSFSYFHNHHKVFYLMMSTASGCDVCDDCDDKLIIEVYEFHVGKV